ncbi:MAG: winged helix-turn-helix transcriptional regulator [Butyrivibrio sp.]|nr:winged helix-turn-helix transcriptional regulator [Butyrivibrio sp.]
MDCEKESKKLQSEFKECQKLLAAIGDETRQYLMSVMIMEKCGGTRVIDIAKKTHLSRPAVSHHMQILKDAGFVTARKEGTMIYYSVNANREGIKKVRKLIDHIDELLDEE